MNSKGQGALEYLLIIGGAIVVAVIVVSVIVSISQRNSETVSEKKKDFETMIDNTIIPPIIKSVDCNSSASEIVVEISPSPSSGITQYCLVINGLPADNCKPLASNLLTFTKEFSNSLLISILADKNGMAYSRPSSPEFLCHPHD